MKAFLLVASAVLTLTLTGCILRPYQNPVQQGILLSAPQIAKLQVGMTQDQVSYLLGAPNLIDPYHPDTWYYIYTNEQNYQPLVQHQIVVNFNPAGQMTAYQEK